MTENIQQTLQLIARECTEAMFQDYGMTLRAVENTTDLESRRGYYLCGVIGFTGRSLRGSVVLATEREVLEACAPQGHTSLRDWIAAVKLVNEFWIGCACLPQEEEQ